MTNNDNFSSGWFVTLGLFVILAVGALFYFDPLNSRISTSPVAITQADARKLEKIKAACEAKWGGIFPVKNKDGTTDYLLRGNGFTPDGNRTEHIILRLPTNAAVNDFWNFELESYKTIEGKTEVGCANKRNSKLLFSFDIETREIVPDVSQPTPTNIFIVEVFAGSLTKGHWQIVMDADPTKGGLKNCLRLPSPNKNVTFYVSKDPAVDDAKAKAKYNRHDRPCYARESQPSFTLSDDSGNYLAVGTCLKIGCQTSFRGPAGNEISIIHRRDRLESLHQDIETLSAFLKKNTVYFGIAK